MQPGQEILQKWDEQAARLHPRMEFTWDGLVLGAGTVLAKAGRDKNGASRVALDDEPRVMALIATAFERPVEPYLLAKISRACELWNEGEKALAHIHLAHAGLPPCGENEALRLFIAEALLADDVPPDALLEAQGFDPATLDLFKYPGQPRVPAGSGRESGEYTYGRANVTPVAFHGRERRPGHRGGSVFDAIRSFLDWLRARGAAREAVPEPEKPSPRGEISPPLQSPETLETEDLQLPKLDPNKIHHIFDDPDHGLNVLIDKFGSSENAFDAVAAATRDAINSQGISGQFEIQVEIGGQSVTVRGRVHNGIVNIGTVFIPWTH